MERFNYPNIEAAENEDMRILYLLECETYGARKDHEERIAELESQIHNMDSQAGING